MGQFWLSVFAVVWTIIYSFTTVVASPCAKIFVPAAVFPVGSTVSASCKVADDCPLTRGRDFWVEWHLGGVLISTKAAVDSGEYEVVVSNFTDMKAELQCGICTATQCNIVDALEIKAADRPVAPHNLTCQLNLTEPITMLCKWEPGPKISDISTNYTLHTAIRGLAQKFVYAPAPEQHFYKIPRNGFTLFDKVVVHILAANAMGQTKSEMLLLDPMETAKLNTPQILRVGPVKFGCLSHRWSLSEKQKWITRSLHFEMKLTPTNKKMLDKEQVISRKARPSNIVEVCGLLHGMIYSSKMRVKYENGPWSEWSQPMVAATSLKAPTGRLVSWLKLSWSPANRHHTAQLCWKPSSQFRPNSMNVSYVVSLRKVADRRKKLCETDQQHCFFQIPLGAKKLYLSATNQAGKSNPTEVTVSRRTDLRAVPNLQVHPQSEESVLVKWTSLENSELSGYVLEWKALSNDIFVHVSFEIMDMNQTSFVVPGLEPYQPYEFSIYPENGDGIGHSNNVTAYTKEKAPSISPKLTFGQITPSYVELHWNEIPLQQRNGIITGYTVYYWDENNHTGVINTIGTERNVVLKDLHPFTAYGILLMTSTNGGSLNGTVITVKTASVDAFEIVLIVIPALVGLALLFFGVFTCLTTQKGLKRFMWPIIPDPANSSIKKWTMTDSMQDLPALKEVKEPVLVCLSHFSLLSLAEKELWKADKNLASGKWSYDRTALQQDRTNSPIDSKTCVPSGHQSECVSYATVLFSSPYRCQSSQSRPPTPAYLRSESTQPLLADEEPASPNPYDKNVTTDGKYNLSSVENFTEFQGDVRGQKSGLWEDFPMLSSLEIGNIQDQA